MPIYEYICNECKKRFSLLQSVGATEKDSKCTECGSDDVKKIVSSFSCSTSGIDVGSTAGASFSGGG